jgi:hypothetical protein
MASRPEDIRGHLDLLADKLEPGIEAKLAENWQSRSPEPQITVNVWPKAVDAVKKDRYSTSTFDLPEEYRAVLALLKKRYEAIGWTVTSAEGEDARNRLFTPTITFAKKPTIVGAPQEGSKRNDTIDPAKEHTPG